LLLSLDPIVLDHAGIYPNIFALNIDGWRWHFGVEDKMVVAVGAVLVTMDCGSVQWAHQDDRNTVYLSSNSFVSFRKHFLHFLHAKICFLSVNQTML